MKQQKRRPRRRKARPRGGQIFGEIGAVKPLVNNFTLTEVVSEEGIETIHRASMRLLKETGMLLIDYPPALETFRKHGAKVEGEMVWIDEETLMHFVRMAPPPLPNWRATLPTMW